MAVGAAIYRLRHTGLLADGDELPAGADAQHTDTYGDCIEAGAGDGNPYPFCDGFPSYRDDDTGSKFHAVASAADGGSVFDSYANSYRNPNR